MEPPDPEASFLLLLRSRLCGDGVPSLPDAFFESLPWPLDDFDRPLLLPLDFAAMAALMCSMSSALSTLPLFEMLL